MGKSVRNTDQPTVSNKEDVLSLLGGSDSPDQGGNPAPVKKTTTPEPKGVVSNKGDVMDLLSGTVKKKDGGGASSATPSPSPSVSPNEAVAAYQNKTLTPKDVDVLAQTDQGKKMGLHMLSPEEKDVFATAHNGVKKGDLTASVAKIIDDFYPASEDPKQNFARRSIQSDVLNMSSQDAILDLKKNVLSSIQKKITDRENALWKPVYYRPGIDKAQMEQIDSDPQIQQMKQQQQQAERAINEYGKMALVSSKDMEPWLNLDAKHPNIQTSIAAEKLGKVAEEKYGADKSSPNKEYNRMKTGFDLITRSLQMDINEALAAGIPQKNGQLLKVAQDKLATLARYRDMYDRLDTEQFPDVGLDKTARYLGDIIAELHPNKLIRTKEDVREAGKVANDRNPGFLDKYGKFVDAAAVKQNEGTFIPRGGGKLNEFLGGVVTSSAKAAIDLLKWKNRTIGSDEDTESLSAKENSPGLRGTSQSGTEPTKIVYDKEGKAYREMQNENYGTLPWNNFFRFAGESLPGLAEFVASEEATGGLATLATAGKVSKATRGIVGLVGATYLTSYNSNREFADANIEDNTSGGEAKKIVAANFLTLANAGIFHMLNASPSKMVEAAISKSVMPDVVKLFEENSWEKLNKKTVEGFLSEHILPRAKAIVEKFAETSGSGAKMGTASVIDQKLKDLVGVMTNADYKPSTIEDNARAFTQQALLMTTVGLPGMISSGLMPHTTREALHQAGLYAPQYIDEINERVDQGELDPKKASGMISMIKTMHEELANAAEQTTNDGTPLTTRQQRDVAIANFRKRGAAAMQENGMDVKGGADSQADKEIKEIKKENNWQSIEETPTFKSIQSMEKGESEEEKGSKKVASMSDIDPAKMYRWEKDGQPVETTGAELINHLETGDIYEKEKPDDKVEEGGKAKDAKGADKKPGEDKEKTPVAKEVVDEAIKEGKIADNMAPHVQADPEQFLKDVSDQALGYTRNEGERVKSDLPNTEKAARDQYGDKVVDAAVKLFPEEEMRSNKTVSRENVIKINNTLENESKEHMQQVRPGASQGERAKVLSELPQRLYESASKLLSGDGGGEEKERLQDAIKGITEKGDYTEESLRNLSGQELADAPRKLLETFRSALAVPEVSPEVSPGGDNAARAEALQSSYDRLLASGANPDDSDMQRLKGRIDSLSPTTTDNGNVKKEQGPESSKGSDADGQKSGQEENGQEKVVTPGGAEPAVSSAPIPEGENPVVGIRDSIVNADRIHQGLQPLVKEFVRSWGSNWNELKRNIINGFSPRQFIEETAARIGKGDRVVFNDYDYATLLFDRLDIQNNIARATDVLNDAVSKEGDSSQPNISSLGERTAAQDLLNHYNAQLEQNDIIGRAIKSETGRALSAIQMMTRMNGELLQWSKDIAHYYNGHVPDSIKDFVARIEKEYKEKNEQLRTHYEEQLKKAADDAFKKAQKSPAPAAKGAKKSVKASGKELADKIRALRPKSGGTASAQIFGLPIAVYDTALVTIANLVEGGAVLIDAINTALRDVDFSSDKDRAAFMAHLQNTEDPARPQAKQASLIQDIDSIAKENGATNLVPEAVRSLRALMISYANDGSVKSLDELVNKTQAALKDALPDIEERDIRDAFSGYGMNPDSEGKVKSEVTKLKEQARAVSQYQDMLQRPPKETEAQEQKRLTKAGELYKKVQGYMREMGIDETPPPTTPEGKKALALEQAKKRAQSIINDLNEQILAGERKQRNGVEPDHDLSILRAERKRLSDQLDDIERANTSPEEKIKQTEDALNRQIANYERQIKNGLDPMKPKPERPTTKQIEELRERKKELKRQVDGLRNDTDPRMDPKQRALAKYNEGLARQIKRLEDKIANKDYEPEGKPPVDFTRDTVSLALEARLKKLQSDFYSTKRAGQEINKKWVQKAMTLAAATKRAFVLSRISTFGRLGAAVGWNTIFEPVEAINGSIIYATSKLGFAKKLNEQAERYGVPNLDALKALVKGEGAAFKALATAQTWKDFVSDAKNGYSELSLLYGHGNEAIPKEARDTWMNLQHGLEAFGRAHGAVKGVSKRMEFMRSYTIRKEAMRRKGEDVGNPVIQQSIGAMAYQDAMRSILMEDNYLSKKYQDAIHELQKGGFGGNILALTLQEMMPIVKIPTNLVLNAGRATLGTPLAGGAIAVRGMIDLMSGGKSEYGISKLSAAESDALLRNLRKGNVGMALMLAGFFAPNAFGASHYYQKGTDQPDGMEEGEVKFFGVTIPKWLADNPYLVTMKIGSSLRNSFDYYTDEKDVAAPTAAARSFVETAFNALKETPIAGTPAEAVKAFEGYGGNWFWYSQVKGTLEPGLLQEIAEDTDNRDGWYKVIGGDRVKRKPESVGDALKSGIPGLREDVDEK